MATSEPLVPTGRPHGERQKLRAAMQAGGIPLAPVRDREAPAGPAGPAPAVGGVPPGFDAFANRSPSQPQIPDEPPAPTEVNRLQEIAVNSPNPFYRELAARILQTGR